MKELKLLFCILVVSVISTSCKTNKNFNMKPSLYKTAEGEAKSVKSYEESMKLWDVPYEDDYVETDFGHTHIIISGKLDGKPLMLLPGLFGDACMWYANVGELSKHYKVYTLDMINYAGKSKPNTKKIKDKNDYVIWMNQILNHYNIEKVSLVGVSYSSWLNLTIAKELPERISSLIMLDPSETFMPMNGGIAWRGFKAFMFFPNRKKYADFFNWIGGGYMDDDMAIWFEHMLDVIEYGSTKMNDVPRHRVFKAEELKEVNMPVLIMAGGKPILYKDPEVFKQKAQMAIPHAKVIIVPGTGHGLNMEKAAYVNDRIVKFLSESQIL